MAKQLHNPRTTPAIRQFAGLATFAAGGWRRTTWQLLAKDRERESIISPRCISGPTFFLPSLFFAQSVKFCVASCAWCLEPSERKRESERVRAWGRALNAQHAKPSTTHCQPIDRWGRLRYLEDWVMPDLNVYLIIITGETSAQHCELEIR